MNLYIRRNCRGVGPRRAVTVNIMDAEGRLVGYATPAMADWLVRSGLAMDVTPREESV